MGIEIRRCTAHQLLHRASAAEECRQWSMFVLDHAGTSLACADRENPLAPLRHGWPVKVYLLTVAIIFNNKGVWSHMGQAQENNNKVQGSASACAPCSSQADRDHSWAHPHGAPCRCLLQGIGTQLLVVIHSFQKHFVAMCIQSMQAERTQQ